MSTELRHQFPHLGFQFHHAAAAAPGPDIPEQKPNIEKSRALQLAVTRVFRYSALPMLAEPRTRTRANLYGRRGE